MDLSLNQFESSMVPDSIKMRRFGSPIEFAKCSPLTNLFALTCEFMKLVELLGLDEATKKKVNDLIMEFAEEGNKRKLQAVNKRFSG
jgi:hypothetical protein